MSTCVLSPPCEPCWATTTTTAITGPTWIDWPSSPTKDSVAHYREDLPVGSVDVAINGHTHVTKEAQVGRCLVLNPGSASYPRGTRGPTMARMLVKDGKILSTKFIDLE